MIHLVLKKNPRGKLMLDMRSLRETNSLNLTTRKDGMGWASMRLY